MSWFNNIIQGIGAGVSVYSTVQGGQAGGGGAGGCHAPSGCFQCPMVGQGDIAGCIDLLAQEYHRVEALGNLPNTLQAATAALAALNNSAYFVQGNDAYLAQAKAVMQHAIQVLQGQGVVLPPPNTTVMVNANGQTVSVPNTGAGGASLGGIPQEYLLIGGGIALIGLVYLLRK